MSDCVHKFGYYKYGDVSGYECKYCGAMASEGRYEVSFKAMQERIAELEAENNRLERAWLALQKRASADRVVELEASLADAHHWRQHWKNESTKAKDENKALREMLQAIVEDGSNYDDRFIAVDTWLFNNAKELLQEQEKEREFQSGVRAVERTLRQEQGE